MERKTYSTIRKYKHIPLKMLLNSYEDDFEALFLNLIKKGIPVEDIIQFKELKIKFNEISLRLS